ncbi:hypothetical protein WJX74_001511, partial [Apatococcus lobatus]
MKHFRKRLLLRLHPDKLAGACEDERQAAESSEAFKEISPKLQQGIFWYQTAELRAAREYQAWVAQFASPVDNGHKRREFCEAHEEQIRTPGWWDSLEIAGLDDPMNPRPYRSYNPRTFKAMQMFKPLRSGGKRDIDAGDIPSSKK